MSPGRCLVLLAGGGDARALWTTSWPFAEFVRHRWPGAWVNSLFRNEGAGRASDLIREAVAITRGRWPDVPALGMVTFVDASKVRRSRQPGRVYLKAGFRREQCCCTPDALDKWGATTGAVVQPDTCLGKNCDGLTTGGLLAFRLIPEDMPDPVTLQQSLF